MVAEYYENVNNSLKTNGNSETRLYDTLESINNRLDTEPSESNQSDYLKMSDHFTGTMSGSAENENGNYIQMETIIR